MPERSLNRKQWRRWRPKPVRRARNRRRASPLQIACRLALTGLASWVFWIAFHSPRLSVRRVEVAGVERVSAERVTRLAGIPLGGNIFRANLYRARRAVESDPLVASAEVARLLPGTIRILVRERRPVFLVSWNRQLFEADEAGVLFRRVAKPSPKLPVLALANVGPLRVGERLRPEILNPALACLQLTASERLLLWKIRVDGPQLLWLNMKVSSRSSPAGKDLLVRLGRPEDLSLKLADAWKVLAGRPQILDDARYLDVSCAGRPVYMAQTPPSPVSASAGDSTAGPAHLQGSRTPSHP